MKSKEEIRNQINEYLKNNDKAALKAHFARDFFSENVIEAINRLENAKIVMKEKDLDSLIGK
ncbi:MAG: hypothetical protein ACTSYC_12610 [Promethearchaeota archaeon]